MLAFYNMMEKNIVMPAHLMDDQIHLGKTGRNLFQDFSAIAESEGVYTAQVSCMPATTLYEVRHHVMCKH